MCVILANLSFILQIQATELTVSPGFCLGPSCQLLSFCDLLAVDDGRLGVFVAKGVPGLPFIPAAAPTNPLMVFVSFDLKNAA